MGYDCQQGLGEHDVTLESIGFTDKDGDGSNIVLNMRIRFSDGEIGNKDLYPFSSDKSLQITRKTLKACGFDMDKRDLSEIMENPTLLKGAKIRATVEEHEWQGKVSNRISWINAIPKPIDKLALANLTMKLRQVKKENLNNEL